MATKHPGLAWLVLTSAACDGEAPPPAPAARYNIALVIVDDIGVDGLAFTREPTDQYARTPVLNQLADEGMVFERAYAMPSCSPTRYTIASGRYGRRAGISAPIRGNQTFEVPITEPSLARYLSDAGYATAMVGKWHLSIWDAEHAGEHPLLMGFDEHHGTLGNTNYYDWPRYDNGVASTDPGYITTRFTDAAVDFVQTAPEPWFLWLGHYAAHGADPHAPPAELLETPITADAPLFDRQRATIEALDHELGRLFDAIPEPQRHRTVIVVVGDNGTDPAVLSSGWSPDLAKGYPYESGIRVPLIVRGPAGARVGRDDTMVHTADLFPTLLQFAGIPPEDVAVSTVGHWDAVAAGALEPWGPRRGDQILIDSVGFASRVHPHYRPRRPRDLVYVEGAYPIGFPPYDDARLGLRTERYKYVQLTRDAQTTAEFFRVQGRHDDGPNLLDSELTPEASAELERLQRLLDAHLAALTTTP